MLDKFKDVYILIWILIFIVVAYVGIAQKLERMEGRIRAHVMIEHSATQEMINGVNNNLANLGIYK